MKFRKKCPSCLAKDKLVRHCRKCYKHTCSECSVIGLCIDCYTSMEDTELVESYFIEKYGVTG